VCVRDVTGANGSFSAKPKPLSSVGVMTGDAARSARPSCVDESETSAE